MIIYYFSHLNHCGIVIQIWPINSISKWWIKRFCYTSEQNVIALPTSVSTLYLMGNLPSFLVLNWVIFSIRQIERPIKSLEKLKIALFRIDLIILLTTQKAVFNSLSCQLSLAPIDSNIDVSNFPSASRHDNLNENNFFVCVSLTQILKRFWRVWMG